MGRNENGGAIALLLVIVIIEAINFIVIVPPNRGISAMGIALCTTYLVWAWWNRGRSK